MLTMGNGFNSASPSRNPARSPLARLIASQWFVLRGTPLGVPVVPEVQQMVKISLASGANACR